MKKVISLFLSLTMLLSIVSVVDFSAYASVETGKCGDNLKYSLDTETGVLTISGTGKMTDYSGTDSHSPFYQNSNIKSVIIGDGVTSIGSSAFRVCTSLTSVTIQDGVTSIGDCAFYYCTSLTSVTIPDSVTSIENEAFSSCTSLTSIDYNGTVSQWNSISVYGNVSKIIKCTDGIIGNGNTVTIDNLKYRIYDDTASLVDYTNTPKNLMIPESVWYEGYTFKVTSIGNSAFSSCESLTNVTIPNSVTNIGEDAFSGCESLTSVTIPNSVTSIGVSAFSECISLTSVTIPDSVTSIKISAFSSCTSLASVTIPNSVTSIGSNAFYNTAYYNDKSNWDKGVLYLSNCLIDTNDNFKSTTDYIIKDGTRIIADFVFSGCASLTSVTIPDSVTSIASFAFYNCTGLTSVTIPNSVTSIGKEAFSNCTSLKSITIPNSVTSIGSSAFSGCTSLTSVTIPNSVTSIGDAAFYNCTSLKSVNYSGTKSQWKAITIGSDNYYLTRAIIICTDGIIGKGNTVTIDNLKYKIYDDTASLVGYTDTPENLVISKNISYEGYTLNVTSIGESAFKGCTSLTSVTVPDSVTSIGDSAFYGCTSLTSVTIGNSVTSIGDCAFYNCTSLTSVTIPDSVTSIGKYAFYKCTSLTSVTIPDSVTSIGDSAFSDCTSLTSITIPDSVTSISNFAFYKCTSLTSVTVPDSVTSIGNYAFNGCTRLTSVTIPNSVTSIGDYVFYNCTSLTSVTIPDSVTSIGHSAFYNCTGLTSVTIPNSVTSIGQEAFFNCSNLKSFNYNGTKAQWKSISGYDNVSQIIKCTDGIYANSNTIIIDSVKYRLNDDYTAEVISYSGTPGNITILESVTYEGLTFKVTSIGSSAFSNCTSLKSATIPISVTSIGDSAFSGCTSLTSVTIPNSVESIGDNAFQNCSSLTNATIGNNVTSIGDNAFNGCSKLKKIEIPDSVTYIGSKAFDGTAFYNTVKNWEDGVLYCGNHLISTKSDVTKITVKASTVSIATGALDNCKSLKKINVLNPKCVINCTIPKTAVIGGAEGSTAEDFAQKNNMSIDYFEECTHSDKVQVVIAATCTEQGAVQSRCADCDKLISQTFTAPLGHTMVITIPAKAPTCTTSGNTQAGYCTVCGYNEVSTVIPATGHNFGNNSANCLVCGVANPNYVAPTQPNQNDTNTSNDEDVTVISKPKSASIKKVKGAKKAVSVEWKKVSGVSGYEIQVATDKKFKKNKKTVTIKKQKTTKTTVKKLKAKKKYYVRIRTYKIVNGKKVYSSWSKVKSVKTK